MQFERVEIFCEYYEKVRQRTKRLLDVIPEDEFDWSPIEGKFSFADLIRHLAAIVRFMYAENVQGEKPSFVSSMSATRNRWRSSESSLPRTCKPSA